jgi:methylmalonyl-CoA mutase cobalamin-binding subunit
LRQQALLNLFGHFEGRDQLDAVLQTIDHAVGVAGDETELVVGGDRHHPGKVAPADVFQNAGFTVKQQGSNYWSRRQSG